jgi:hypothetical protein
MGMRQTPEEDADRASPKLNEERAMPATRRHFKQTVSLNDRLKIFSDELKAKAAALRPGPERNELIKRARRAEIASDIDEWANSARLQAPK